MNFIIYIVGNKIERFYLEAVQEYEKRLSRYCKIQLMQLKDDEQLLKKLSSKHYQILIATSGQSHSSEELAAEIANLGLSGFSDIAIIIGSERISPDAVFALSPLDMDLGLQATLIFEQIYRSYRILNHQAYHK